MLPRFAACIDETTGVHKMAYMRLGYCAGSREAHRLSGELTLSHLVSLIAALKSN